MRPRDIFTDTGHRKKRTFSLVLSFQGNISCHVKYNPRILFTNIYRLCELTSDVKIFMKTINNSSFAHVFKLGFFHNISPENF